MGLARTAWHEAAHAVAAFLVGWHVDRLAVMPGRSPAGVCWMRVPEEEPRMPDWDWVTPAKVAFTTAAPMLADRTTRDVQDLEDAAILCLRGLHEDHFRCRLWAGETAAADDDEPALARLPHGFDSAATNWPLLRLPEGSRVLRTMGDVHRVEAAFIRAAHHEVVVRCADNVTRVARALLARPDLTLDGDGARRIATPFKPFTYRTFKTALRRAGLDIVEAQ